MQSEHPPALRSSPTGHATVRGVRRTIPSYRPGGGRWKRKSAPRTYHTDRLKAVISGVCGRRYRLTHIGRLVCQVLAKRQAVSRIGGSHVATLPYEHRIAKSA